MRQRFLAQMLVMLAPDGGGGGVATDVVAPGTPGSFVQGVGDAPTGGPTPVPGIVIDEPVTPPTPQPNSPTMFTAAEMEAARRQERDKLYEDQKRLKEERDDYRRRVEERERSEAEAQRIAAEAATAAAQSEMDARQLVEAKDQEWKSKFAQLQSEQETTQALFARERIHSELQAHRFARMQESEDTILPELRDLISGNTPDEIDASVAMLADRTVRILSGVQAATQQARQSAQGTSATAPATGPVDNVTTQQQFTPEDLKNMSEDEYRRLRPQLLAAASRQATGR